MKRIELAALLLLLVAPVARAQDAWTLLTADLKTESVLLRGVGPEGVRVVPTGTPDERLVPMDKFVELTRPAPPVGAPKGRFDLHLVGGDHVNGEPAGVKGERLVWRNPVVGDVEIPLARLAAITKPGARAPDDRRREDVVVLANKDTVRGAIAGITAEQVTVQTEGGGLTPLPLAGIESVGFAAAAQPAGAKDKPAFRVRLDDGSSVVATAVTADEQNLQLTLAANTPPRPVEIAHVTGVEQVNGPVSWLSSRAPSQNVYLPYLGGAGGGAGLEFPARMNANYRGDPIRFKERTYPRGIGVHSYSRLTFDLDPAANYKAFRTRYALDPSSDRGDVTVRVKLDDRVVHEQPHFGPATLSPAIVVDLGDARTLTLEVDFGAGIHAMDRLNWIEPALLKARPAADEPTTAPATALP